VRIGRIALDGPDGPVARLAAAADDGRHAVDLRVAERLRLERAGATADGARRIAAALFPGSLTQVLAAGPVFTDALARALDAAEEPALLDLDLVRFLSPVDPPVLRDFMAFERHAVQAFGRLGRQPPPTLYELPVYYKGNPTTLIGHQAEVPWPPYTDYLDFELELGFVVGRAGRDITPGQARGHVFGVTALNDFSARDIQGREMGGGLGPAKGKDFATALGPWVVTADAVDLSALPMAVRVNGETWASGSSAEAMWSLEELVAWASAGEPLQPGEVLGSGTLGDGCGLEHGRRLEPGDTVELEVGGVGVLRNTIGARMPPGWQPEPRAPGRSV
jgi:2-keto-4-pentenoate hydratase/2-oxohepta-3-ene-1,7-dioic acid hydratase in catechol pathway